jgi:hypothetical protein
MAEGEARILQLAPATMSPWRSREIGAGEVVRIHGREIPVPQTLSGHKFAARHIEAGENVVKYGTTIGRATSDIAAGEALDTSNVSARHSSRFIPSPNAEHWGR